MAAAQITISQVTGIKTYEQARALVSGCRVLSSSTTRYPSFKTEFNSDFNTIIRDLEDAQAQEKPAIIMKRLSNELRDAAPIVFQTYLMSKDLQSKIRKWFQTDRGLADNIIPTAQQVAHYKTVVGNFRTTFTLEINRTESEFQQGEVNETLNCGAYPDVVARMLDELKAQREEQLRQAGRELTESRGAPHVEEVKRFLDYYNEGVDPIFTFPDERKKDGFRKIWNAQSGSFIDEPGKCLMLSTAFANIFQEEASLPAEQRIRSDKIRYTLINDERNRQLYERAIAEADGILQLNAEGRQENRTNNGFASQAANIDPIFLTYYILYGKMKLSVPDYYKLTQFLYLLGQVNRGKNAMRIQFNEKAPKIPGVAELLAQISDSSDIHTAPWHLTFHRLGDLIATAGGINPYRFNESVTRPGFSWRYFLGLNNRGAAMSFLSQMYLLEKSIDAVYPLSLRMFHQTIVGRNCPLANTNYVTGNFTRFHVTRDAGPDEEEED